MKPGKDAPTSSASSLANQLRQLRETRSDKPSIRQVAAETKISNAYLSQLERGVAENPSPHVLHRLAEYYDVPYESLMTLAGYVMPRPAKSGAPSNLEILLKSAKLSAEEQEQVKKFIRYLRSK
jgi:HTH-type transcriptional regulator, competence development regulator